MKRTIFICTFLFWVLIGYSQAWFPMGSGFNNLVGNANVGAINFYNGNIIAGGFYKKSGTTMLNALSSWDGNQWNPFGTGLWNTGTPDSAGGVSALTIYKGDLVVSGGFDVAGGTDPWDLSYSVANVAKWDGIQWLPMSQWGDGVNSSCMELQVFNDNLFLGGFFNAALDSTGVKTTRDIAKWNDTVFSAVGQFYSNHPASYEATMALCLFDNKLIVGGYFNSIDGTPYGSYGYIATYNDTIWDSLSSGLNDVVFSLVEYNGELYAGGNFTATGEGVPANHVAKWNGTQWLPVGEGLNDSVWVLCVDSAQNKLYAGGFFTQTGLGQPAKYIAEWNGTNWVEVGGGANDFVLSLFSKDSNLYVGGAFTQVGTTPANHIAVWGNNPVGINEISKESRKAKIYPHPNNGNFTLEYELKNNESGFMNITDISGKLVASYALANTKNNLQINASDLNNGVYLYQVVVNGKTVNADKLVIIRD